MSGGMAIAIGAGFVLGLLFIAVNVSVAFEVAESKDRSGISWGLFAFLFPLAGPFLVWMLPPREPRS